MREIVNSAVLLMADVLEADTVVLYMEDAEGFAPIASFSVHKNTRFYRKNLDNGDLLGKIIEKWPPLFITDDEKLLKFLPYEKDAITRVFMAVPFKVGRKRAILCADSSVLHNFSEKQQSLAVRFAEFIKELFVHELKQRKLFVNSAKYTLAVKTITIFFSDVPLNEKFSRWCEEIDVDVGLFFIKQGTDILPLLIYARDPEMEGMVDSIIIGPRSLVYISMERGEIFIFDTEENEAFEGFSSFGAVIPVDVKRMKGCLFLGSKNKGFFSKNLEDFLKLSAEIIGFVSLSEIESKTSPIINDAVELKNNLRIMCNRSLRDGRKLSVALIRLTGLYKMREKFGFWDYEEKLREIFDGLQREFFPQQIIWARLNENLFLALKFNKDRNADKEFRKLFREEIIKRFDEKKPDVTFLLFPDDVGDYDGLCRKLEKYVIQYKPNRRLLV